MTGADTGRDRRLPGAGPSAAALGGFLVVGIVGLAAGSPELARAVLLGLPLVVVSGLAVAWALAPGGWPDALAHGIAVLAGGFGTVVAAGVLLGASPIGLSATAWLVTLALVWLASLAIGWIRGGRLGAAGLLGDRLAGLGDARARADGTRPVAAWLPPRGRLDVQALAVPLAVAALSVLVVGVSLRLARLGVEAQPHPGFTQLWALPAERGDGTAISVRNAEGATRTYRLELRREGGVLQAWDGIRLASGETWTETVTTPAGGGLFEARLYRLPEAEIYRSVTLAPGAG